MKLVKAEKSRFRQDRSAKLYDAEKTAPASELRNAIVGHNSTGATTLVTPSLELLNELHSAASMIMDREEYEAMLREVEQALGSHPVAA